MGRIKGKNFALAAIGTLRRVDESKKLLCSPRKLKRIYDPTRMLPGCLGDAQSAFQFLFIRPPMVEQPRRDARWVDWASLESLSGDPRASIGRLILDGTNRLIAEVGGVFPRRPAVWLVVQ